MEVFGGNEVETKADEVQNVGIKCIYIIKGIFVACSKIELITCLEATLMLNKNQVAET